MSSCLPLISFLLILPHVTCQPQVTYPIPWSTVPSPPPDALATGNVELGPCVCDLTFQRCDVNCYCDADCSALEISRFTSTLPNGPIPISVRKCMDRDLLDVNTRGGITVHIMDNLLCVQYDNNPSKGNFLSSPTSLTSQQQQQQRNLANQNGIYAHDETIPNSIVPIGADGYYYVATSINAARMTSSGLVTTNAGRLTLPVPDPAGSCTDMSSVQFLTPRTTSCHITTTSNQCRVGGILSIHRLIQDVYVGMTRTATPVTTNNYVALTIGSWSIMDVATGAIISTTTAPINATLSTTSFPIPSFSNCTCQNVLLSMSYHIGYQLIGSISSVVVHVVLGNVASSDCSTISIQQKYGVSFNLTDTQLQSRPKSGNPGYRTGFPILSGRLVTNTIAQTSVSAISQDIDGLRVLTRQSDNRCTLPGATGGIPFIATFGEDTLLQCHLMLNLTGLMERCSTGLFDILNVTNTHVGAWGNADFTHINDWIQLTVDPYTVTSSWSAPSRQCRSLITSLAFEFMTTDFGAELNPQTRIIAARQYYQTSTWTYLGTDTSALQAFPVTVSITFIHVAADSVNEYIPSAPPIFPRAPYDVLYPLYIPSSSSHLSISYFVSTLLLFMCQILIH